MLGLTALKNFDGFTSALHDVATSLILTTLTDKYRFVSGEDMKYKNRMGYIPIKFAILPVNTIHNKSLSMTKVVTTRSKANLKPTVSLKFKRIES